MYRDLPMDVRIDRIGVLLAKAVFILVKKEREVEAQGKNGAETCVKE